MAHNDSQLKIENNKRSALLYLLPLTVLLALALRLLVWRWREFYPLSGDEQEYLTQALTLLQQRQYVELNLMRPPLYTVVLAAWIVLFDSAIQNLRLVQVVISALTVVPIWALTWQLFRSQRIAFVAALLVALDYTLAATATELLTETVFLFGLSGALWLLLKAGGERRLWLYALLTGLTLGALALVRSVALPLVGLATIWLLGVAWARHKAHANQHPLASIRPIRWLRWALVQPFCLVPFAVCLVVLPWTARNYVVYHALIVIDTTGGENLWLDNNPSAATPADPLGREAAKRDLYELGADRAARQALASQRGIAEITGNPIWFAEKAWGEAKQFFALQYFDELRAKRAIWVPPAEVWAKILLGDGLWLVLLLAGAIGLTIYDLRFWIYDYRTSAATRQPQKLSAEITRANEPLAIVNPKWVCAAWALYIFATGLIFHVELRYRLPLYPVLVPFAAWLLVWLVETGYLRLCRQPLHGTVGRGAILVAWVVGGALATMTLLHRNYPAEAWLLANKHAALGRAEQALADGDASAAERAAAAALGWDDTSALARVSLARAAVLRGDRAAAAAALDGAITALAAHPQAHLLRGALLRRDGDIVTAKAALAYETGSLQDLQAWSWQAFAPLGPPPAELAIGAGLDLGYLRGCYPAEHGYRWTRAEARFQLSRPAGATTIEFELTSGRPAGAMQPTIAVYNGSVELGRVELTAGWQTYRFPLASAEKTVELTLRSSTFRPRAIDSASSDNRELGVMVRRVALK